MRWKLILLASFAAAAAGFLAWLAITLAAFGSARTLARHDWLLAGSLVLPLGTAVLAAVFTYRHSAKRRKLQAVITAMLALLFTVAAYFLAWAFIPSRLTIPRTYEVRHAR
jgi:MFS family permease